MRDVTNATVDTFGFAVSHSDGHGNTHSHRAGEYAHAHGTFYHTHVESDYASGVTNTYAHCHAYRDTVHLHRDGFTDAICDAKLVGVLADSPAGGRGDGQPAARVLLDQHDTPADGDRRNE